MIYCVCLCLIFLCKEIQIFCSSFVSNSVRRWDRWSGSVIYWTKGVTQLMYRKCRLSLCYHRLAMCALLPALKLKWKTHQSTRLSEHYYSISFITHSIIKTDRTPKVFTWNIMLPDVGVSWFLHLIRIVTPYF